MWPRMTWAEKHEYIGLLATSDQRAYDNVRITSWHTKHYPVVHRAWQYYCNSHDQMHETEILASDVIVLVPTVKSKGKESIDYVIMDI